MLQGELLEPGYIRAQYVRVTRGCQFYSGENNYPLSGNFKGTVNRRKFVILKSLRQNSATDERNRDDFIREFRHRIQNLMIWLFLRGSFIRGRGEKGRSENIEIALKFIEKSRSRAGERRSVGIKRLNRTLGEKWLVVRIYFR